MVINIISGIASQYNLQAVIPMEHSNSQQPFQQYRIATHRTLLSSLPPMEDKNKVKALIEGAVLRHELRLYRGDMNYVEDLQVILEHDRELAPLILKEHKVMISKDGNTVLNQCFDCGRYMPPFKYCNNCQNAHYCSQACQMRSKFTHQSTCKPRQLPAIDAALQVEVHVGGDLGKDVEVYYQHQMRMSHRIRGESFVNELFSFFMGQGKVQLPDGSHPQIINGHLKIARVVDPSPPPAQSPFLPYNFDQIAEVYTCNTVLAPLVEQILKKGGILTHMVREVHNNHLHLIYIFQCA